MKNNDDELSIHFTLLHALAHDDAEYAKRDYDCFTVIIALNCAEDMSNFKLEITRTAQFKGVEAPMRTKKYRINEPELNKFLVAIANVEEGTIVINYDGKFFSKVLVTLEKFDINPLIALRSNKNTGDTKPVITVGLNYVPFRWYECIWDGIKDFCGVIYNYITGK